MDAVEIASDGMLTSVMGRGATPGEAVHALWSRLHALNPGESVVLGAFKKDRAEYRLTKEGWQRLTPDPLGPIDGAVRTISERLSRLRVASWPEPQPEPSQAASSLIVQRLMTINSLTSVTMQMVRPGEWVAHMPAAEIASDGMLSSAMGCGSTLEQSVEALWDGLVFLGPEEAVVLNAGSIERTEHRLTEAGWEMLTPERAGPLDGLVKAVADRLDRLRNRSEPPTLG